ncbi:MAG TPA: AMP-binding protein [Symbiobacteriaceae bacterium]|nr:AMP-binding protein [Symbiobacteriaceae bacterium]
MPKSKLLETLWHRVQQNPDGVAYEFLFPHGQVEKLTYLQLCDRAGHLAAQLLASQPAGGSGPALLVHTAGLDYVTALYACMLAGVPAVPAYPPEPWRPEVSANRLARIIADARPTAVLTTEEFAQPVLAAGGPDWHPTVMTDWNWQRAEGESGRFEAPGGGDVAILQYTSGSTGAPKGVILRHSNLEHNLEAIRQRFELTAESRGVSWLPPYHDMGLIGCILTPLYVGFPIRLMAPADFLKNPLLWLRQISDTRATASGAPNFAYDLCVRRRMSAADLASLDLRSWTLAFCGADRISGNTLEAFAKKFALTGFQRSSYLLCYGLAEATLLVTGGRWDGMVMQGRACRPVAEVTAEQPAGVGLSHVRCGRPLPDQELAIVDPARAVRVPEGTEGEIWLSGSSVAGGYWSGDDAEMFAVLDGRRFLRTGDLGYLADGQLVITGRVKDVIVYRGVNYHAVDIEEAAAAAVAGLRPVCAAFMVDADPEPLIALVAEARSSLGEPADIAARIRTQVLQATGLRLNAVIITPPGTIPRTSSGKVQRRLCRDRFLAREYDSCVAFGDDHCRSVMALAIQGREAASDELVQMICGMFGAVCGVGDVRPDQNFFELGGDSIRAAECAAILEDALNITIPVELIMRSFTPAGLAEALAGAWAAQHGDLRLLEQRLEDLAQGRAALGFAPTGG